MHMMTQHRLHMKLILMTFLVKCLRFSAESVRMNGGEYTGQFIYSKLNSEPPSDAQRDRETVNKAAVHSGNEMFERERICCSVTALLTQRGQTLPSLAEHSNQTLIINHIYFYSTPTNTVRCRNHTANL